MRGVRGVDVADSFAAAEFDDLAILEVAWLAVGNVVDRYHAAYASMGRLRLWRGREPLVQRAALVRLEVAERDPAQPLGRNHAAQGIAGKPKHLVQPGVEYQRLVPEHEELIEGE